MTELDHAARKSFRATYTPVKIPPDGKQKVPLRRPIEKRGIMANILIEDEELELLRKDPHLNGRRKEEMQRALNVIEKIVEDNKKRIITQDSIFSSSSSSPSIGDISVDSLIRICQRIADLREQDIKSFQNVYKTISKDYEKRSIEAIKRRPPLFKSQSSSATANTTRSSRSKPWSKSTVDTSSPSSSSSASSINLSTHEMLEATEKARTNAPLEDQIEIKLPDLKSLLRWSVNEEIQKEHASEILRHVENNFAKAISSKDYEKWASARAARANFAVMALRQAETAEPVGYLHLERLNFVPAGIEKGELVHSVPLTPGEEVNISHKEWSNTSEEFSRIVTDFMENYSEEGVTEKSELSQSSNSQEQHSSGFNTGVTASGGYGPVSISTSVGISISDSSSESEQIARRHSMDTTHKASARSKKEHKTSFKVASAAGTEDQEVRKIKNPFADRAARVDYYQLLRKWRVDLYRYGVRLTYDLTIPDPGADLLSKLLEIQNIKAELEEGFEFDLNPADIQPDTDIIQKLENKYKTEIAPPPVQTMPLNHPFIKDFMGPGMDSTIEWIEAWSQKIPDGYSLDKATMNGSHHLFTDGTAEITGDNKYVFPNNEDLALLKGIIDQFYVTLQGKNLRWLKYELTMTFTPTKETILAWQSRVYGQLYDAAKATYEENRNLKKEKLSRLLEEVGAQDPLSLRKIEREEVMKGVVNFLFGPSFVFAPLWAVWLRESKLSMYEEASGWAALAQHFAWLDVKAYGEKVIKFLHQAIEWENMLYFIYPYFWSVTNDWSEKMSIDHPDLLHRAFLKSGSARVVLTIRPHFEDAFVTFMEGYDVLPADHPYFSIAKEIEAYANTNYPGVKAANPVEDARPLLLPKQQKAWKDMQDISKLLDRYYEKKGNKYPSTQQGLAALSEFTEGKPGGVDGIPTVPTKDPWDRNYIYVSPSEHIYVSPGERGDYDLASYGADGQEDSQPRTDESGDITSWVEASLIGTWYEYTPTSALDVAFAEEQEIPDA